MLACDDSTKKKSGRHIEGAARHRNGAGTARQEYRPLWGLNVVWVIMRVPLAHRPGHGLSVPMGLSLYLKAPQAKALKRPCPSRSALARESVDFVAEQLPGRRMQVFADGGYATKAFLRYLPNNVDVVSRLLVTGNLYELPQPPRRPKRGRRPSKGKLLGCANTLAHTRLGWHEHPTEVGAKVQAWQGLWHAVLPGRHIRMVVVRRQSAKRAQKPGLRKPPPRVEAFFTTDLSRTLESILELSHHRWAVEIALRDSYGFDGLGQDQCRQVERILAANTFRLVMSAARTLWFVERANHHHGLDLCRYRPWYRKKAAPSQFNIVWACREALYKDGILPIPRFNPDLSENYQEPTNSMPLGA